MIPNSVRRLRADISAVLLIAFLYQLITPILVLASEPVDSSDFERALRASICQVNFTSSDETSQSDDTPSHTDNFVCDLCVLCNLETASQIDLLPEVVSFERIIGRPQPYGKTESVRLTPPLFATPAVPRAPPLG